MEQGNTNQEKAEFEALLEPEKCLEHPICVVQIRRSHDASHTPRCTEVCAQLNIEEGALTRIETHAKHGVLLVPFSAISSSNCLEIFLYTRS